MNILVINCGSSSLKFQLINSRTVEGASCKKDSVKESESTES